MKLKLWKIGWTIATRVEYIRWWSKLYRFLFQKKYANIKLRSWDNLENLDAFLRNLDYRKDGPKQLWDVVGSPEWVQFCADTVISRGGDVGLNNDIQPKGPMDCDEYACYIANTYSSKLKVTTQLLTINYLLDGKRHGHMVCLLLEGSNFLGLPARLSHAGNWGVFHGFESLNEVLNHIIDTSKQWNQSKNAELVGWSLLDPKTLKLNKASTEFPKQSKVENV